MAPTEQNLYSEPIRPFETIESALEFMLLLESVIAEVSADLQRRLQDSPPERYKNGLDLASYKVHQLSSHVEKSRRILNDLTLIRGVLFADSAPLTTHRAVPDGMQPASPLSELVRLDTALEKPFRVTEPAKEETCDA